MLKKSTSRADNTAMIQKPIMRRYKSLFNKVLGISDSSQIPNPER
jgi:hypothetical protein